MEDLQDKLIKAIDEDVRSNADLVDDMLNKEKKVLLDDQINFFKEGLEKDKSAYLEGELKELRYYAAMKSSRDKLDVKKKLIELRSQYVKRFLLFHILLNTEIIWRKHFPHRRSARMVILKSVRKTLNSCSQF